MLISTLAGSNETEIIEFVSSYFDFEYERTEKKFYSDYPTLILEQDYHIGGLCAIVRKIASLTGNDKYLGPKSQCLKTPSEFSSRTKLIEDLVSIYNNPVDPSSKILKKFEELLSADICQHNLDKAQRKLLKKEKAGRSNRKRDEAGRLVKEVLTKKELPELEHAFLEGIQLSISDLVAFLPVMQFLIANLTSQSSEFIQNYSGTSHSISLILQNDINDSRKQQLIGLIECVK